MIGAPYANGFGRRRCASNRLNFAVLKGFANPKAPGLHRHLLTCNCQPVIRNFNSRCRYGEPRPPRLATVAWKTSRCLFANLFRPNYRVAGRIHDYRLIARTAYARDRWSGLADRSNTRHRAKNRRPPRMSRPVCFDPMDVTREERAETLESVHQPEEARDEHRLRDCIQDEMRARVRQPILSASGQYRAWSPKSVNTSGDNRRPPAGRGQMATRSPS